ncbi:hypothetical protein, partial [Paenibacillus koleovorans]|uniref:hypothetical protein n=1 Tax=Paenibacillus koleovorans TaxID=121608 RepID=UPI0013E2C15A
INSPSLVKAGELHEHLEFTETNLSVYRLAASVAPQDTPSTPGRENASHKKESREAEREILH